MDELKRSNTRQVETDDDLEHDRKPSPPAWKVQMKQDLASMNFNDQVQHIAPQKPENGLFPKMLQQRSEGEQDTAAIHQAAAYGIQGSGGAMPHMDRIQSAFGHHDISGIKAHVGGDAAVANEAMGSAAYATGGDVAFKESPDLHTAAHEAAHVVQQAQGVNLPGGVGSVGDTYEKQADSVADRVVSGQSAEGILDEAPGDGSPQVQRKTEAGDATAVQASQIQFAEPPVGTDGKSVTREALLLAKRREMEWREAKYKGKTVGWYVVKLDRGQIATGEPVPAALEGLSLADNPELEAWCEAFEKALGQQAFSSEGVPTATQMAGKCVQIMDAYVKHLEKAEGKSEELDELFGRILGNKKEDTHIAGAVGTENETVRAAAGGNLREQMTLSINFLYQFGEDFASRKGSDFTDFIAQADGIANKAGTPTDTLKEALEKLQLPSNEGEYLFPDNKKIKEMQDESRVKNPDSDQHSTEMEAGDLGRASLSDREIAFMKLEKENLATQKLTWEEGRRKWLINEASAFAEKAREASMPAGGGVSGTTGRIMNAGEALGAGDKLGRRAAAIGYLLPIRAHTLIEILQAAVVYDVEQETKDLTMYLKIQPFNTTGVYANEMFWRVVASTEKKGGS